MSDSQKPAFDAFAILGLPCQLDLDEARIDEAWHELSRRWHPDAEGGDADRVAEINRARELILRPGPRLRHWLELNDRSARNAAMSETMMNLFSKVGGTLQSTDELLKQRAAATTAMGRAVLAQSEWDCQSKLQALLGEINEAIAAAITQLPLIDAGGDLALAESTAASLGFLEKWEQQIRERLVSLMTG